MLIHETDLWGRGYSDRPLDIPHDSRLFAMQIFFAVASSPLSWTGASSAGFSIIAFSLGAGITISFAAHYPYLVNSIVLLAPAGILRCMPDEYESVFFRYSSFVPSRYLKRLIGTLLGDSNNAHILQYDDAGSGRLDAPNELATEQKENLDIPAIVQWQFDFHKGFCHSFVDTIAYGPIMHQQSDWKKFGDVVHGEAPSSSPGCRPSRLRNKKVLIVFGDSDAVVDRQTSLRRSYRSLWGFSILRDQDSGWGSWFSRSKLRGCAQAHLRFLDALRQAVLLRVEV